MKILSIGTSGKNCTVAISEDNKIIKEININDGLTHSQNLLPAIDNLFKETSLNISDMDYYACSIGPGSFTGIRIGVATIKGICLGVPKPDVAVPSLLALAYHVKDFEGYIVSCIDAKNDNVYAGIYKRENGVITQEGDYIVDNVNVLIEKVKSLDGNITIVGDGATLVANACGVHKEPEESSLEYASSICEAATYMIAKGEITDGVHLSPLYLKKSQAERELEEKS